MELYVTITTLITIWTCPPNVQPTVINNQCKTVQMEQSSQAPTRVPPYVTPAKAAPLPTVLTYRGSGRKDTTKSCGHEPSKRNPSGCYDIYTPLL